MELWDKGWQLKPLFHNSISGQRERGPGKSWENPGGSGMEQKEILKQMIEFNKTAFDNTFKVMTKLQEQWENMMGLIVEQSSWPPEGKDMLTNWVMAYRKWCQDCKKVLDDSFKRLEVNLEVPGKSEMAKPVSVKPSRSKPRKTQQQKPARRKVKSAAAGQAGKPKVE
jgi:hypothetical protein